MNVFLPDMFTPNWLPADRYKLRPVGYCRLLEGARYNEPHSQIWLSASENSGQAS